jgi:hypothetical protein
LNKLCKKPSHFSERAFFYARICKDRCMISTDSKI